MNSSFIKSLAIEFLSLDTQSPSYDFDRASILAKAKGYFTPLRRNNHSPAKLLKYVGVSYMGAVNSSQKMEKGKKLNYDSYVIYLSPSDSSGVQVCPMASEGCRMACLNFSGHALIAERAKGRANPIAVSRLLKTWFVAFARQHAEEVICHEIKRYSIKAKKQGHNFAVRLNGTSDLYWGSVIKRFPDIQMYDYTKNPSFLKLSKKFPNWHVTFSFSGENRDACLSAIEQGFNVAFPVVGKEHVQELIETGKGYSMDETDLRFLDSGDNQFGILSVKQTLRTGDGVEKGFLLSKAGFLAFQESITIKGK